MKKVAVMLSGCGFRDGSEIHEATLTLLALDEAGVQAQCLAPDIPQSRVINHCTMEPVNETRRVLVEAARIARGKIRDVREARAEEFDALIFPGGAGAACNLSDFGAGGPTVTVHPDVLAFARAVHSAGKPVGLICISPHMAPFIAGAGVRYTFGNAPEAEARVDALGGEHVRCAVTDCVIDAGKRIVSTPAYMYGNARIGDVATGIRKLVSAVLEMA
jgi:enhancing lycopene biosynthesis protein 2